jgi:hypothetical protein
MKKNKVYYLRFEDLRLRDTPLIPNAFFTAAVLLKNVPEFTALVPECRQCAKTDPAALDRLVTSFSPAAVQSPLLGFASLLLFDLVPLFAVEPISDNAILSLFVD